MQNVEGYAGSAGTEPHAWETGLMDAITYVGLDVHKATVSVALAESGRGGEIRQIGGFENRPEVLAKLVARLSRGGRRLSFCYEAGLSGYGLHRLLTGLDHDCVVVALSLIPIKAGDRVKTDRRDPLMLAKLHRASKPGGVPDRRGRQTRLRSQIRYRCRRQDDVLDGNDAAVAHDHLRIASLASYYGCLSSPLRWREHIQPELEFAADSLQIAQSMILDAIYDCSSTDRVR